MVVGAELVSFSAVLTLRRAGCRTVLMTTTQPTPESYAAFTIAARSPLLGVPVATRTRWPASSATPHCAVSRSRT